MQAASQLMLMLPLYLHVYQKLDDDDDDVEVNYLSGVNLMMLVILILDGEHRITVPA